MRIVSIIGHLYWVAAMGRGDGDLVASMWNSLLNHVCNKHNGHEGPYQRCIDGPLEKRQWMKRNSKAFQELQKIVSSPLLLRDIHQLSPDVQTFSLESFHSLLIQFAPKANAFSEEGMQARTQLAVMHYNENSTKVQVETADGEHRWKVKTSKARKGHFTVCPVKEETTYSYVDNLLLNAVESCEGSS
ncbi:uncharacterized protein LOC144115024 isoform X2 [Amblyomma americanum]